MRVLMWLVLWLVTLGTLDIDVLYSDGLHIRLVGWPKKLEGLLRGVDDETTHDTDI